MAKVHFAPYCAVKYVGVKAKEFSISLARPKPRLKRGDIVIVDKLTAFNLVKKGFGEFEMVEDISFTKEDVKAEAEKLEAEKLEAEKLEAEKLEAEKLEAERIEAEKLEAERLEAERLEAEKLEAEKLEAETKAQEKSE